MKIAHRTSINLILLLSVATSLTAIAQEDDGPYKPSSYDSAASAKKYIPWPMSQNSKINQGGIILTPTFLQAGNISQQTYKEIKIVDQPYVPGMLVQPPREILSPDPDAPQPSTEDHQTLRQLANKWYAGYIGNAIPDSTARARLESLYSEAARTPDTPDISTISESRRASLISQNADRAVQFLVAEKNILSTYPEAQILRYGKILAPTPLLSNDSKRRLRNDAIKFFSGRYIADENAAAQRLSITRAKTAEQNKMVVRLPGDRVGTFRVIEQTIPKQQNIGESYYNGIFNLFPCTNGEVKEEVQKNGNPTISKLRDRFFIAEHPVSGRTWEDIGLPDLIHTSLVVGRWYLEDAAFIRVTKKCTDNSWRNAQVISSINEMVSTWKFATWILAHGGSGTYSPNDTLREFMAFETSGSNAYDELDKLTFSTTADSNNARCRTRYGAFPNGSYGFNWVCHQSINAFAKIRWRVIPVHYLVSASKFGDTGNLGITDIRNECTCYGKANHACVPGAGCCMESIPFSDGQGSNLSRAWHPTKHWIDPEFKYKEYPINIPGWDESPSTSQINSQ